jgi:hypothetical protein
MQRLSERKSFRCQRQSGRPRRRLVTGESGPLLPSPALAGHGSYRGKGLPLRLDWQHVRCSPGRRGRYHPRPPQTRTCAIHAFGSSRESFADDVMDAFGAILCHRHSLTEGIYLVSLAIHVVSWTRFAGCMSRPLFLDMVLSTRRLPSLLRVPASLVPRSRRYYEGATTSHLRISGRLFCSLPPPT